MSKEMGTDRLRVQRIMLVVALVAATLWACTKGSRNPATPAPSTSTSNGEPATATLFGRTVSLPSGSVIYVLDRRGAMSYGEYSYTNRSGKTVKGNRLDVTKDGVIASVRELPEGVKFNILAHNCARALFATQAVLASEGNKKAAEDWILRQESYGSSGTGPALAMALQDKTVLTLLLLTDGNPLCGAAGPQAHMAMALAANDHGAAIHTFGVGSKGSFREFMVELAEATDGTYTQALE